MLLRNLTAFALACIFSCAVHATSNQRVPPPVLEEWELLGAGETGTWGQQLFLKEAEETKGVMLLSPDAYTGDIVVRYDVLALTPATVLVAILCASDPGSGDSLTVPPDYDGNIGLWMEGTENYFMAFKNAPHGVTPFIRKNPAASQPLAIAGENLMLAGRYYAVEVGRKGERIWLSVDGETLVEATDSEPLQGGRIALRIRGTAGFQGGCLIRNLEIEGTIANE